MSRETQGTKPLLRVVVLGRGKAGGSLAASCIVAGVDVQLLSGRRPPRSLPAVDVVFLAVPDDALHAVAARTQQRLPPSGPATLLVHLAGSLGSTVLPGPRVGVFHPLASLDGRTPIPFGSLCAWEASDARGARLLQQLAKAMGLVPARVRDADRARYHAGAVVAGNLSVALLRRGMDLLMAAGVPEAAARVALGQLLRSTAERAIDRPLGEALTGPVARGDIETIRRHLEVLDREPTDTNDLYRRLGRVLVEEVAAHDKKVRRRLREALDAPPTDRPSTDKPSTTRSRAEPPRKGVRPDQ